MAEAVERRGAHKQPPPPVDSLDLRQRARRDRIVQATVHLMGDHDYDSLQMKDITAAAGVALGTTYRYFSSKDHLVAEALLAWSEQFKRESDAPPGRSVDRLRIAFRRAARAFSPCGDGLGMLEGDDVERWKSDATGAGAVEKVGGGGEGHDEPSVLGWSSRAVSRRAPFGMSS